MFDYNINRNVYNLISNRDNTMVYNNIDNSSNLRYNNMHYRFDMFSI